MTALFGGAAQWWLVLAGWSVIVALWHTSATALGLATWRHWRRRASASTEYRVAATAFGFATALTLATPAVVLFQPRATPSPAIHPVVLGSRPATPAATAPPSRSRSPRPTAWSASARGTAAAVVPWIGAVWLAGFLIALVRFTAGWGVTRWIRRRAVAMQSAIVLKAAAEATVRWGLPSATLLASAHVDGPVVVGVRAPAILLPRDLEQHLAADALPPLLAHELAHVQRRDYLANLAQSLADTILWCSPGARWISRVVRETREYCCDDVVAARCGAGPYASALTTLAGLGVAARARPAVSAAGPRLVVRIRRLLQKDTMVRFKRVRLIGLSATTAALLVAGLGLVPLSSSAIASGQDRTSVGAASLMTPITVSFDREARGSAIVVEAIEPTAGGMCGVATLRNDAAIEVRSVRFDADVTKKGSWGVQAGDVRSIRIAPGATGKVALNLMPANDALAIGGSGPSHVRCRLLIVQFADGSSWVASPSAQADAARLRAATGVPQVVSFTTPIAGPVPMGFVHTQRGLAVRLRDLTSSDAAACGVATIENRANVAVSGVRFAAQAMAGGPEGSSLGSVLSTSSPMLDVDVPPGDTATVAANLVSLEDMRQTIRTGSPQVMCAIAEVRYANGSAWTSPPAAIFAPTQAEVARALIGRPAAPAAAFCRDQDGNEYSQGALAPIALEPGPTLARCHDGGWVEYELPAKRPDAH
jgi:beta-lactamase regulating signal transducer with metallopeptidase domain